MIGAFWKRAWPKLPVMIPGIIKKLARAQSNAYTYIFDNRRRKLPCDVNFFEAFCRQDGEPGRACDSLAAPKVIITRGHLINSRAKLKLWRDEKN
jgi:hypothetical protein